MTAHFFDIQTLFKLDQKIWIIDKNNPSKPLLKLSRYEYNVMKKELYLKDDLKLRIGGKYYYFSKDGFDKIKRMCKKYRTNVTDIEFSFVEFENDEVMESLRYDLDTSAMRHLYRTKDVVYILCSKSKNKFYDNLIEKLDRHLRKKGIQPRDYYYLIEDGTKVVDTDEVVYKKIKIMLQHLVGYMTEGDNFIDEKLTDFTDVYYYGNDRSESTEVGLSNKVFGKLMKNTKGYLREIITDIVKNENKTLTSNYVSSNKMNRFVTTSYDLEYNNKLKRFGDF